MTIIKSKEEFCERWFERGIAKKMLMGFLFVLAVASVILWPAALLHWIFKWSFGKCCLALLFLVPCLALLSWLSADLLEAGLLERW